jgi:oxygen-independent coproporphyrinogen-3 oxidase
VLAELGRQHRGEDVGSIAATVAESGVKTWSMDLIIGSASESDRDLIESMDTMIEQDHRPPHISCYLLTVERGTPLSQDPTRHPVDDVLAHRYELVDDYLSAHGYAWYEISNWSLEGHEARHNQLYWDQGSYRGLGCAAHSHDGGHRSWNVASLTSYLERVEAGADPMADEEIVDGESRHFESLALSLRTRRGILASSELQIEGLAGYLVESEGRWILTRPGRLLANEITQRVALSMDEPSSQRLPPTSLVDHDHDS